ncbi:4808_t:CDS:2 [Ambispora gerdemannii]|uniref:4808_t:CDS:1 n=1 Tax=Ambispora gerdemannii TaxID=144530 RepID=A0A9N9EZN7_9GLOM|nr:4808_t:CDS:2 [Ambispora gerdemannii]
MRILKNNLFVSLFLLVSSRLVSGDDYIVGTPKPKAPSSPQVREYNFDVKKVTLAPDGFSRRIWTVNGQFPGPPIVAFKNDQVKVKVTNNLGDQETSIHWHGIKQVGTPWYDGSVGVTGCAIPNGKSLTYDFKTPDPGTYWWHSHYIAQYVDGIAGSFIVHDPADPYLSLYDEEFTVLLTDYHHDEVSTNLGILQLPFDAGFREPSPDNGLINGRNNYNCTKAPAGSKCTANAGYAKFKFQRGKRYRLRLINTSAQALIFFSIDNHDLNIIETDGFDIKFQQAHRVPVHAGQRVSVVVIANQAADNFWMRGEIDVQCYFQPPVNLDPKFNAIVHYEGAKENVDPTTKPWTDALEHCIDLNPNTLKPLNPELIPSPVGTSLSLFLDVHPDEQKRVRFFINNSSFVHDENNPIINKVYNNYNLSAINPNQNLYTFNKLGEVIQVVIQRDHPFHLHGHNFWVLGVGQNETYQQGVSTLNTVTAIKRDTAVVPSAGWLVIRFVADNPGVWMFHCHIEWHFQLGMSVQFLEIPDKLKTLSQPPEARSLCP